MVIRIEGPRTQVFVNDVKVTDSTGRPQLCRPKKLPMNRTGAYVLTRAGSGCRIIAIRTVVYFKSIAVLSLGAEQDEYAPFHQN